MNENQLVFSIHSSRVRCLLKLIYSHRKHPNDKYLKDTAINDLIRLSNNCKDNHIKTEGLIQVAEYHAVLGNFKECELYIEKNLYFINNEASLVRQRPRLLVENQTRILKIYARY